MGHFTPCWPNPTSIINGHLSPSIIGILRGCRRDPTAYDQLRRVVPNRGDPSSIGDWRSTTRSNLAPIDDAMTSVARWPESTVVHVFAGMTGQTSHR